MFPSLAIIGQKKASNWNPILWKDQVTVTVTVVYEWIHLLFEIEKDLSFFLSLSLPNPIYSNQAVIVENNTVFVCQPISLG
jgi:hypothetical protein